MASIGSNIRRLREEQALSQEALAERLHVTRQTVSNYERGRSQPDLAMLQSIAGALGADLSALLYGMPPSPERRQRLRRWGLAAGLFLLLLAGALLLRPWAELRQERFYDIAPGVLLRCFWDPLWMLLGGWCAGEGLLLLLRARPLRGGWLPAARRALLLLLGLWALLLLPELLCTLINLFSFPEAPAGLPPIPVYSALLCRFLLPLPRKAPLLLPLPGLLLSLFGCPPLREKG